MSRSFRVIDGCPVPASIAPYVARVLKAAGQSANSIYRGSDARALLLAHGKHDQADLFHTLPAGVANPPGRSTHELFNDGVAYHLPVGHPLKEWCQGVDSGADTVESRNAVVRAARECGWEIKHPYSAGVELHHWNFVKQPKPRNPLQRLHIIAERARLPRK